MNLTFWPLLVCPILNNFLFVMLCFVFMNFLSPLSFSLHKTDALIFRHKAALLEEGGGEEGTAGILICFTGLLGTCEVLFGLPPGKGDPGQGLSTFCSFFFFFGDITIQLILGKGFSAYYFSVCHWKSFKCYTKSLKI